MTVTYQFTTSADDDVVIGIINPSPSIYVKQVSISGFINQQVKTMFIANKAEVTKRNIGKTSSDTGYLTLAPLGKAQKKTDIWDYGTATTGILGQYLSLGLGSLPTATIPTTPITS